MSDGRDERLRLTILGSGTLLPDDERRSSAYHLRAGGLDCLLDCGSGTLHGFDRHGIGWRTLDLVAFTHYHTDHLGDLAPLLFALKHGIRPARTAPLTILGPPGLLERLDALVAAFGEHVEDPGFPLEPVELGRSGSWRGPEGHPEVRFHPTPHTDRSVAHRWEADGGVVAYTGDTGPDSELADFLRGADVLVCEVALPESTDMENHLTPRRAAELARRAQPGLLVTTHVYPPLVPEEVPGLVREAGFGGRVEAARDGMVVEVDGGEIVVG